MVQMAALLACLEPAELPPDAIEVGRIADAWGIQGWFKVIPYSASPEALFSSKRWFLLPPEKRAGVMAKAPVFSGSQLLKIRIAKEHSDSIVVQADGVSDRNTAELLKSARVFIARSSFPTPEEGEFYWVDLLDCSVSNREGVALGLVKDLITTGPQTVIVVERETVVDSETKLIQVLIPFVNAYVDRVDIAAKQILVDWQLDY